MNKFFNKFKKNLFLAQLPYFGDKAVFSKIHLSFRKSK